MQDNPNVFKEWLNKLQENSWNLELLVSGFAIFGLFQFNEYLEHQFYRLNANNTGDDIYYMIVGNLMGILMVGTGIFIVSLIVHVFLRGLWIGAIGLRFVSGDIDYDNLNYNENFKKYIRKNVGEFDDFILKLENLASLMFSFTFLLFFISLSIIIWIVGSSVIIQVLYNTFEGKAPFAVFTALFYILLAIGAIVGFDFITLGLLKKVKSNWFSKVYMLLYVFVGMVTLSFLWRPLLYNFIDQRRIRWFVVFTFPLLFIFLVLGNLQFVPYSLFPALNNDKSQGLFQSVKLKENARASFNYVFYDDLRELRKAKKAYAPIIVMSIPSYTIRDAHLEVFVKYDEKLEKALLKQDSTIVAFEKSGIRTLLYDQSEYDKDFTEKNNALRRKYETLKTKDAKAAERMRNTFYKEQQAYYQANLSKILELFRDVLSFEINGRTVPKESVGFNFFEHPNLGEKGILCNFPLDTLAIQGTNYLTFNKLHFNENLQEFERYDFTIPFIYVKNGE